MRYLLVAPFALTLSLAPLQAEDAAADEGLSLIEQGAKLLLEGLADEMGPAMDDLRGMADTLQPAMRDFVAQMGPALADLLSKVDDITLYHAPEMLPNGDIIIRRKTPEEQAEPDGEEIEI